MITTNSIPEICELAIRIESSADPGRQVSCVADLRVDAGDVPIGDEECVISISKLTVAINVEGLQPLQGSRFGEPRKPNAVCIETGIDHSNQAERGFSAGAKAEISGRGSLASGFINGAISRSSKTQVSVAVKDRTEHLRVRAIPNLRWEVSEIEDVDLKGTYLENDTLVSFATVDRANRSSIDVAVSVKQRHLIIRQIALDNTSINFFKRLSFNQRRLLDIFIAKSISAAVDCEKKYRGEIKISQFVSELQNEL